MLDFWTNCQVDCAILSEKLLEAFFAAFQLELAIADVNQKLGLYVTLAAPATLIENILAAAIQVLLHVLVKDLLLAACAWTKLLSVFAGLEMTH